MKKELNPEESVRNEQFGADDKAAESSEQMSKNTGDLEDAGNSEETEATAEVSPDAATEETEATAEVSPEAATEDESLEKELVEPLSVEEQKENTPTADTESPEPDTMMEGGLVEESDTTGEVSDDEPEESEPEEDIEDATTGEAVGDVVPNHQPEEDRYKDIDLPAVDYSGFSKNDLVETLGLILENRPVAEIRDDVERIRIHFYKKHKAEAEEQKTKFLEGGGKIEDFKPDHDHLEDRLKDYLEKYRVKRSDQSRVQEAEKNENLRKKYDIIDKIKDLVNREESINKTFQEFRSLQNEWHSIGVVPQSALKDLWENYHHNVEIFYDYIKINKELRDLDLKKNLELKITLCEKAEELLLEPNAVNAFRILQEFHNQWREIGPVPHESKNEVWERFKEATSKINKRHHEYFESQKDEQRKNLEAKIAICEKVEEINLQEFKLFRDFDEKSEEIVKLQKLWRTIGFAPKKHNNRIYQRFREACDTFFEKKRSFYSDNKEVQQDNLQKKTELCIQAESFMESTDWKSTTDALIKLQREWKEIGPVPRKQSEKIWKRFRKACDHFFARKAEHFATVDTSYEDNLAAKKKIIEELENFDESMDVKVAFETLKDIQRRWAEIGFVPFNAKEEVNQNYRNALNKQFDRLKINDEDKNILKYRNKLDSVKSNPKLARKVRTEREKFYTRIRQLENDITLWENNIGFFAKSKAAESMISEVEEKIENAKKTIRILEEKVKMIDLTGLDE
ncbi:MAG: DUF349 domain-containing protein [Bacteroidales bacterium]|nr:DUF349 domain-containing protein [Bacteroidales bacterium]